MTNCKKQDGNTALEVLFLQVKHERVSQNGVKCTCTVSGCVIPSERRTQPDARACAARCTALIMLFPSHTAELAEVHRVRESFNMGSFLSGTDVELIYCMGRK